jgi:hypothetical protein
MACFGIALYFLLYNEEVYGSGIVAAPFLTTALERNIL